MPWGIGAIPATHAPVSGRAHPDPHTYVTAHHTYTIDPRLQAYQPIPMEPRIELPEMVTLDSFGYLRTGIQSILTPESQIEPMWGGAAGGLAPSRLDQGQEQFTTQQRDTELLLDAGRQDSDIQVSSTLQGAANDFISDFRMVQEYAEGAYTAKQKRRGRASDPSRAAPNLEQTLQQRRVEARQQGGVDYDGDLKSCSICLMDFDDGEVVIRVVCRHMFHVECYNDYVISEQNPVCPNCRGAPTISARFRFVGADAGSEHSYGTASSVPPAQTLPWSPADVPQPHGYHHARTALPDGRPAILIDPGAWTSVGGAARGKEIAIAAVRAGRKPSQKKMSTPLEIQGVGHGTNACPYEAILPVALPTTDGGAVEYNLEVPLVEKSKRENCQADQLPLILGLRSMQDKSAVLEMRKGQEILTFPGPGGYTVNWSPGTVHIPLSTAMSGHLMAPCVEYGTVPKSTGGVKKATNTLHATPTQSHPAGDPASGMMGSGPIEESGAPRQHRLRKQQQLPVKRPPNDRAASSSSSSSMKTAGSGQASSTRSQ